MSGRIAVAIAHKELVENVLSWRFLLALVLSTLILVTSVLALGASYEEDVAAHRARVDAMESSGPPGANPDLQLARVLGRPNALGIFVDGPGNELRRAEPTGASSGPLVTRGGGFGSVVMVQSFSTGAAAEPEVASGSASPTNQRFSPLDLGFVVVVVMTFTAVLFSHDALSGERERGTLKLMLANSVPKDAVLLGKYLGGMASVLLPFAAGLLAALALLQGRGVVLTGDERLRLLLVVLLAIPLVSAFYLGGLFVSGASRRSSTSLLAVTLAWLVLVFGAGNVAAVVAKETGSVTHDELTQRFQEIDDRHAARRETLQAELGRVQRAFDRPQETDADRAAGADAQRRLLELYDEMNDVDAQVRAERAAVVAEARGRLVSQLERAEAIASVSPSEAYQGLATALARSDYWSYKAVADAAEAYRREVERARQEWAEDNQPTWGPDGNVSIRVTDGQFQAPVFHHAEPTVAEQLSSPSGVRGLLVLMAYNLVGFAAAYFAFLRYDVR